MTRKRTIGAFTVRNAFKLGYEPDIFRKMLLADGVAKGTASKISTILTALYAGTILPGDVRSIDGAYRRVKVSETALEIAFANYVSDSTVTAREAMDFEWDEEWDAAVTVGSDYETWDGAAVREEIRTLAKSITDRLS